ncbi:unnamed protein product [Pieris macdunnoughi]|uniref:Uncharacterized protein n=1 Tax=Pieris macdunnoughi TaxID=345717 RepID=A0A821TFG2_9NEOP|nr:unnamed protein product [Pieris macdunnoughi]
MCAPAARPAFTPRAACGLLLYETAWAAEHAVQFMLKRHSFNWAEDSAPNHSVKITIWRSERQTMFSHKIMQSVSILDSSVQCAAATYARKRHGRVKTGNGQDDRILSPLAYLPPCCDVTHAPTHRLLIDFGIKQNNSTYSLTLYEDVPNSCVYYGVS